ncbi:MAG TPA: hypothetical protein VL749_00370 [Patescibacteria group bacterium]|nr:hypothetical protein [Patescibacteria group bacterium]
MTATQLSTDAPEREPVMARTWTASLLATAALGLAFAGLVLGFRPSPVQAVVGQNIAGSIATFGLTVLFTAVGVILRRRRVEHSVGWLLLFFGLAAGVTSLIWGITYIGGLPNGDQGLGRAVAWIGAAVSLPMWTYLVTSLIVRFPSGATETPADARILRLAAVASATSGVLAALRPGPFLVYPSFSNPLELSGTLGNAITLLSTVASLGAIAVAGAGALSMVGRYRRAAQVERLQLRWFAYAAVLTLSGGALYLALGVLIAPDNDAIRESTYVILILAIYSLPIAVLQAISRHRLYDIDTIIGRTFAYGALTAILAGLYAASVRLFNALFVLFTGQTDETALVLSTLVLATTFTPIKSRLELVAARRFKSSGPELEPPSGSAPAAVPELDARLEAAIRRAVADALRERDSAGRRGA